MKIREIKHRFIRHIFLCAVLITALYAFPLNSHGMKKWQPGVTPQLGEKEIRRREIRLGEVEGETVKGEEEKKEKESRDEDKDLCRDPSGPQDPIGFPVKESDKQKNDKCESLCVTPSALQDLVRQRGKEGNEWKDAVKSIHLEDIDDTTFKLLTEYVLTQFPNLVELSLNRTEVTHHGLLYLGDLTNLEVVILSDGTLLPCKEVRRHLEPTEYRKSMVIGMTERPDVSTTQLKFIPFEYSCTTGMAKDHSEFRLSDSSKKAPIFIKSNVEVDASGLEELASSHDRDTIEILRVIDANDSVLSYLNEFPKLKELNLSGGSQITEIGLMKLGPLTKLLVLDLSGCTQINDSGLQHIAENCHALQELFLNKCGGITDRGLHYTGICCKKLIKLDLTQTKITDGGIQILAIEGYYPRLSWLDLSECTGITSKSKSYLGSLPNLETLIDPQGHTFNIEQPTQLPKQQKRVGRSKSSKQRPSSRRFFPSDSGLQVESSQSLQELPVASSKQRKSRRSKQCQSAREEGREKTT